MKTTKSMIYASLGGVAGLITMGIGFQQPSLTVAAVTLATQGWLVKEILEQKELNKSTTTQVMALAEDMIHFSATQAKQLETLTTQCQSLDRNIETLKKDTNSLRKSQLRNWSKSQKNEAKLNKLVDKIANLEQPETTAKTIVKTETIKASVVSMPKPSEKYAHIFVDGGNFAGAMDKLKITPDYQALKVVLTDIAKEANKTIFKYYLGVHFPIFMREKRLINDLTKEGYEVSTFDILERNNDKNKIVGDDVQLALDINNQVKKGDIVLLLSGDGDFIPAVKQIQQKGAKVIVVAHSEMLNDKLSDLADECIRLEDLQYDIVKYNPLIKSKVTAA